MMAAIKDNLVTLQCADPDAQSLLWEYAQRRRAVDLAFAAGLEQALKRAGFKPPTPDGTHHESSCCYTPSELHAEAQAVCSCDDEACGMLVRCEDHREHPVFAKYFKNKHSIAPSAARICKSSTWTSTRTRTDFLLQLPLNRRDP